MTAHEFYTEITVDFLRFFVNGLNWIAFHAHIAFLTFIEVDSKFRVEKSITLTKALLFRFFLPRKRLGSLKSV